MVGEKKGERSVSIPEVKKIMEGVKEKITLINGEEGMTHFQEITFDYVNNFAKMSHKDATKIKEMLVDKYEIEELYAINIVNIDPKSIPELRMILEKSYVGKSFNDEKLQEILYTIEEMKT
ncbi:MAG: DNA-directed RNA polymerase, subunit F (RpoF) [Promethearchaeota archaeon]|nr:MAG: DNA-directed RNA polymerase, subunit F (RpoF) [Candidatus Lokiarchaeota archaeon]